MLILSKQNDCNNIGMESEVILDLIENTTDYQSIKITITENCCQKYTQEINLDTGFTDSIYISENNQMLLLGPETIEKTIFGDSIYHIVLEIIKKDGTIITTDNCFFFDCTIQCILFTEGMNTENNDMILTHYALTQGSNCGCNCENLCKLLKRLKELLSLTEEECNEC